MTMKFDYNETSEEKEVVAYINRNGFLKIKNEFSDVVYSFSPDNQNIILSGTVVWKPEKAKKKFYKGDSVTITF